MCVCLFCLSVCLFFSLFIYFFFTQTLAPSHYINTSNNKANIMFFDSGKKISPPLLKDNNTQNLKTNKINNEKTLYFMSYFEVVNSVISLVVES